MDGSPLVEVNFHKYVEVTIKVGKARSVLNKMSKYQFSLDRKSPELIYIANIRLIMEYANAEWAGGNAIDLHCLDMVQKDAALDGRCRMA